MCGIAGFKNLSSTTNPIETSLLERMQQTLAHRGPDDSGIWKSDKHHIGFAHRRLSIIDVSSAGHQPMMNKDKTIVIVFNGEIYNHQTLRKELESLGHRYSSNSDSETLIHAYEQWGINFIYKLEGMFAFALFDTKTNELFLVRDRLGIKPLYFSTQGNHVSFASEIKALWTLPWIKKETNDIASYHYLTFMVTPAPYTIYKNIYKLPAGFYAKLDTNNELSFCEWYTPLTNQTSSEKKEYENEQFCIERIRSLLQESTKKRMISDVPFGAFLSGGIDSSLNVALMAHEIGKVKTFTVAFSDGPESNELKWARKIAKIFDTDHHEIMISEKDAFHFFDKMIYHLDEPLADPVCIPFYHVAKLAKDAGVTVVQVGEGSDELFFGYDVYAQYYKLFNRLWKPTHKVPSFIKQTTFTAAKRFLSNTNHLDILHNWSHNKNLFWGGAIAFNETQKQNVNHLLARSNEIDPIVEKIYKGLKQNYDSHSIVDYHTKKLIEHDPNSDFMKRVTYLELKQRLPELLLMRADKMAMATSIETRVPFLDHKLVEFALNIPAHLKFKNNTTKYILKKACEGIIPNEIIYRKKIGFATPIVRWCNYGKYFQKNFGQKHDTNTNNSYTNAIQKWVLKNNES